MNDVKTALKKEDTSKRKSTIIRKREKNNSNRLFLSLARSLRMCQNKSLAMNVIQHETGVRAKCGAGGDQFVQLTRAAVARYESEMAARTRSDGVCRV